MRTARRVRHAYCQKGETYRYGPLFRRRGEHDWMHLNQAVHEFWFDASPCSHPDLTAKQRKQLEELLEEFGHCIGDGNTSDARRQKNLKEKIPYVRLPVKPGYERHSEPPFKKNPKVRQLTIDFVRDLQRRGLVSRCTAEEQEFVCNSLLLPKSKDSYRFVCTFKGLNANMLRDPYGMRTLDAVMAALEGATWFSVLDIVDGFFNLPLYPVDRGYTAFHTPIGMFKWNVLPQGTSVSAQIFQRAMDRWFAAFLWKSVIVWVDDILVHSRSFAEHIRHLRQVLEVADKYGLVFNRKKLVIARRQVKYIGYIFGVNGISTDPDKLSAVHRMAVPKTRKQVKMFLGFAGFYRRFMPPDYASIIAPLTELTKPSLPYRWTASCQRAFDRVKLLLTTTPVLVHPDFSLPFHVHCDASGKGIGAVLSQYVNGAYRPIAFCSKRLLPHQQHWSPAQLEAYAVYYAVCVKWRYYLSLAKTVVHSDHRNLTWLFNNAHKGMLGRWYTHLVAYDLDITYVSGKTQVVADPLSRIFRATCREPVNMISASSQVAKILSNVAGCQLLDYAMVGAACAHLWIMALPASVGTASADQWGNVKELLERSFVSRKLPRNMPRHIWASHQRADPYLGPIVSYLTQTARQSSGKIPKGMRAISQSYMMREGCYITVRFVMLVQGLLTKGGRCRYPRAYTTR